MQSFDISPKSKIAVHKQRSTKNLNQANISNIIEENNTLKLKLNKFKYDQVYFEENPKDVLIILTCQAMVL